jgi:hypothetical protein
MGFSFTRAVFHALHRDHIAIRPVANAFQFGRRRFHAGDAVTTVSGAFQYRALKVFDNGVTDKKLYHLIPVKRARPAGNFYKTAQFYGLKLVAPGIVNLQNLASGVFSGQFKDIVTDGKPQSLIIEFLIIIYIA